MVDATERRTEVVQFTDKYHSYRIAHGPQYNAGEQAQVASEEADRLVAEGAAVRISAVSPDASDDGKAPAHPNKDKMVKQTHVK